MESLETKSQKNIDLGFILKLLLAVVPVLSLIVAALHYYLLFMSFRGMSTSLLTVKDYLDKSVEFIPVVLLLVFVGLSLGMFSEDEDKKKLKELPPEEVIQHYDKRIKRLETGAKWTKIIAYTCLIILLLRIVFWSPSVFSLSILSFIIFVTLILTNGRRMVKHVGRIKFANSTVIDGNIPFFGLFCLVFIGILSGVNTSIDVYSETLNEEVILIDVIEVGYLKKQDSMVSLESRTGDLIFQIQISDDDYKTYGCLFAEKYLEGRYFCFGDK